MKQFKVSFALLLPFLLLLLLPVLPIQKTFASSLTWSTKASLLTARYGHGSAEVNGKIYVVGGFSGSSFLASTEEYDPSTDTWSSKANMGTPRMSLAVVSTGGKVYAIGGQQNTTYFNTVEAYDPNTNTWTTKQSLPSALTALAGVAGSDGKIYVAVNSTFESYDPSNDTWTTKTGMRIPRSGLALAATSNGKIYAIGGNDGSGVSSAVEMYDIATDTWTTKASLNTGRWGSAAVTGVDGYIYAMGGTTSNDGTTKTNTVEVYNPATNAWSYDTSFNTARGFLTASSLSDGRVYAIGGATDNGTPLSTVEETTIPHVANKVTYFTANDGTNFSRSTFPSPLLSWSSKASLLTARYGHGAAAASNGKIYVVGGFDGSSYLSSTEEYDPSTDTWTSKANMGTARINLAVVSVDGKVYAIGGQQNTTYFSTVEAYDPSTNTWTTKQSMPSALTSLAAAVGSDGKIYVADNSTFEVYDPGSDTWTSKASMPTSRSGLALSATSDGKIYAIGGYNGANPISTAEEYDIATNTWTTKNPLTTARWFPSAVTGIDGYIYVLGGVTNNDGTVKTNSVEAYNPITDTWSYDSNMSIARGNFAVASLSDGRIYAIGGATDNGTPLASVESARAISNLTQQRVDSNGNVILSINNATGYADSGFVLYEGTLGNLPDFSVNGTGDQYGLNLWFDTGNNNEFFAWNGSNVMTGLDSDTYGLGPSSSSGIISISGSSNFFLMSDGQNHTLSDLKNGSVSGISSSTKVAVWIGVNTNSGSISSTIQSINGL